MITKLTLKQLSESIQDDLICLLDSQFGEVEYIEEVKDMACQIVVDKVNELIKIMVKNETNS